MSALRHAWGKGGGRWGRGAREGGPEHWWTPKVVAGDGPMMGGIHLLLQLNANVTGMDPLVPHSTLSPMRLLARG